MDMVERGKAAVAESGSDVRIHLPAYAARAAIAAVFDGMAEPSEAVCEAGYDTLAEIGCAPLADEAKTTWIAMLTAMRAEMGL